jgi:phosphatidylinositol-3-phosphatase
MGKGLRRAALAVAATVLVIVAGCSSPGPSTRRTSAPAPSASAPASSDRPPANAPAPSDRASASVPAGAAPDHVLIVVFENKGSGQVVGSPSAPYLNELMTRSAVYTGFRAETHPSQPNYIALFSGSTQGVTSDACPVQLHGTPNLGRQLLDAGRTFAGYSEGLPDAGYTGCGTRRYARKHNPWVDFDNLPAAVNQPADAMPTDYAQLPTVSFLIPDLCHDMHDCPVSTGDAWAQSHVDPYARWAKAHDAALIITFD